MQLRAEQAPQVTGEGVTKVREVLQTLPGVHVDNEGEFHFRGGGQHEVLPVVDGLSAWKDEKKADTVTLFVGAPAIHKEPSRSRLQPEQLTESHSNLAMEISAEAQVNDSLLVLPFTPISYWETYRVSVDSQLTLPTALDSLRYEYQRCDKLPCRELVVPYLADVLFRQALQYRKPDDITEITELMKQYKGLLKETWGRQRYAARWEWIQGHSKR